MTSPTTPRIDPSARSREGWSILRRPRAIWHLLTDAGAPIAPRMVALLALAYVIFPLDAIPDVIPFVGWLDDLGVFSGAIAFLARRAAEYEARRATLPAPGGADHPSRS